MLTQLRFSNFKSWAEEKHVDFGRITGLFGPNSSGKSAILQTLLLLKQTSQLDDGNLFLHFGDSHGDYTDFGSYTEIIHKRDRRRRLLLGMTWSDTNRRRIAPRSRPQPNEYSLDIQLSAARSHGQERVRVERLKYVLGDFLDFSDTTAATFDTNVLRENLQIECSRPSRRSVGYEIRLRWGERVKIDLPSRRQYEPSGAYRIPYRAFYDLEAKAHDSDDQSVPRLARHQSPIGPFLRTVPRRIDEFLTRVYYLGPIREYPRRYNSWVGTLPATVGRRGEWTVQILLASQSGDSRNEEQPKIDDVEVWLDKLGVAENVDLRPIGDGSRIWELILTPAKGGGTKANITDVGFGVSQILPVVVALLYAQPGSTVLLEHPEIHLHPRVQMDLVDFFIYAAKERGIQIVFESHSEYMLARLQRRLAESNGSDSPVSTKDVKLYFCSLENGRSTLDPLEVNRNGSIQNWPHDFFGDTFTERMAIAKANVRAGG